MDKITEWAKKGERKFDRTTVPVPVMGYTRGTGNSTVPMSTSRRALSRVSTGTTRGMMDIMFRSLPDAILAIS